MSTADDDFLDFDDLSLGEDDSDSLVIREFNERWENAASQEECNTILGEYCREHPSLEIRIRSIIDVPNFVRDAGEHLPTRLGPYKIVSELAVGGMGKVYEAEDEKLSRTVAVKTIRIGRAADKKLVKRFEYEREALACLHHTHIVPIYSAGEDNGLLYFAMPLIKGPSLADLVATMSRWSLPATDRVTTWNEILSKAMTEATWRRNLRRMGTRLNGTTSKTYASESSPRSVAPASVTPPLTEGYFRHVAEIIAVTAEALHSAHEAGVLHFDVKPSNILIEPIAKTCPSAGRRMLVESRKDWLSLVAKWWKRPWFQENDNQGRTTVHPWLIDFGLADVAGPEADDLMPENRTGAQRSRGFGTEGYMAPEMLIHRSVSRDEGSPLEAPQSALGRRTDVWSLGVTLYQLLTLQMPFAISQDVRDTKVHPRKPRELVPQLPGELETIVLKALKKPLEDRYATVGEFAEDLRRWLNGFPTHAGHQYPGRHFLWWTRRRPAAAFAAGMTAAFVIASLLGAALAVRVYQMKTETAKAETQVVQAEKQVFQKDLEAKKRELDLMSVARLRAPIRTEAWFETAWAKTRETSASRPDKDGRFQGQFVALLEHIDVRRAKSIPINANMLAFAPKEKSLLIGRFDTAEKGRPVTQVAISSLEGQSEPTAKRFESFGVIGFGSGGEARYLELDPANPSILRLRDASTGIEVCSLKPSRVGASAVTAHTLARDGSHAAGIVSPLRKRTSEETQAHNPMVPVGDTSSVVVWNLATGEIKLDVEAKLTPGFDLVLSPDGALLATWDASGRSHEVAVWDVKAKSHIGRFPSTQGAITSVAFGPDPVWSDDGKDSRWQLAVGEHGGMITVWNPKTRAVQSLARGSDFDVKTMDFNPDGTLLASAGRNNLRIWDTASGNCILKVPAGNYQFAVAFSADGRRLAVGKSPAFGFAGGVDIYDLENGRGLRTLSGLRQRIEKIAISADGRRIAALSNDWQVGLFDKETGTLLGIVEGPEGYLTDNAAVALNADGTRLFCSAGTVAKLWDVKGKRLIRSWKLPPALTEVAGFRPDGRLILIRQETREARLPPVGEVHPKAHPRVCRSYELPEQGDAKKLVEITDFDWYVEYIAMTPDAAYFAVQGASSKNGKPKRILHVYDGSTGKSIGSIPTSIANLDAGTSMRFDPKGTRLGVRRDGGDPSRHDLFEIPSLRLAGSVIDATATNVGGSRWITHLEATADRPELFLLNEQGHPAPLLRIVRDVGMNGAEGMKFTPDGNHVVWGNQDGTVTVCDLDEVQMRLAGVGLGW